MQMKSKVAEDVVARIVAQLEQGEIPWRKPWSTIDGPRGYDGRAYNGVNVIMTAISGRTTPVWLSTGRAQKLGGRLKAGEQKHGTPIIWWGMQHRHVADDATGEKKVVKVPILRGWFMYNLDQFEGVPEPKWYRERLAAGVKVEERISEAEAVVAAWTEGPTIEHGGNVACYRAGTDTVQMPPFVAFDKPESYYDTLFHELIHSTGHAKRLNRLEQGRAASVAFRQSYAREELVAELGGAFILSTLGIDSAALDQNHAGYIQSWLKALKSDPAELIVAAGAAKKAATLIVGEAEQDEEQDDNGSEAA